MRLLCVFKSVTEPSLSPPLSPSTTTRRAKIFHFILKVHSVLFDKKVRVKKNKIKRELGEGGMSE